MIYNLEFNDPFGKSHHVTLNWQLSCYSDMESGKVMKHCYQKGNYDDMRRILGEVNWNSCLINGSVDEMWGIICDHLSRAVKTCVPCRRVISKEELMFHRKPIWMKDELLGHTREKKRLKNTRSLKRRSISRIMLKKRNEVKREPRKAIKEYEKDIASKAKRDPKGFYKFVNSKMKTKPRVADLLTRME